MDISIIGCGYLGAVHAAAMAHLGHSVTAIDTDYQRIAMLQAGTPPFHEPGFPELLSSGLASGRLRYTTDPRELAAAQVHFICVGTPSIAGSDECDVSYVEAAVETLLPLLSPRTDGPHVIVGKSTVPVGTAARLAARIEDALPGFASLIWNPEFLREGFGVKDTLEPDRMIYGLADNDLALESARLLDTVYETMLLRDTPRLLMNYPTAELVKVSANSFLAMKISYINAVAEVCEATGGDVTQVAQAIGLDERIGALFLRAGIGYGGGCLPKDTHAFAHRASELGCTGIPGLISEVDEVNEGRRNRVIELATELCGGSLIGESVTVLGAAFKPGTDDLRESGAIDIALRLRSAGANVTVTDPQALENVASIYPELATSYDPIVAARGASVVILATEWPEFDEIDPVAMAMVTARRQIIDGRSALRAPQWRDAGWNVFSLGQALPAMAEV